MDQVQRYEPQAARLPVTGINREGVTSSMMSIREKAKRNGKERVKEKQLRIKAHPCPSAQQEILKQPWTPETVGPALGRYHGLWTAIQVQLKLVVRMWADSISKALGVLWQTHNLITVNVNGTVPFIMVCILMVEQALLQVYLQGNFRKLKGSEKYCFLVFLNNRTDTNVFQAWRD